MTVRILVGFVAAAAIAFFARRMRSLSFSGAIAAVVVGTAAVAAGWSWGAILILYFASSTALSRIGREEKERRTAPIVEKGGERDATQVLANGLVFAVAALGSIVQPDARWLALGAGSLAASAADTWATEIGTLYGGIPRSILSFRPVPAGTSGGVSIAGLVATLLGAAFIAIVTALAANRMPLVAILVGGVVGSLIDSLVGATIQSRRWCDSCARETERKLHDCGNATRQLKGLSGLDNDAVNFVSAFAGGLLAALLSR